jgi:SAM-dependent methyltransferase
VNQTLPDGSAEAVRAQQLEEWAEVARSWCGFDPENRPITDRLVQRADIRPGDTVVDLACGTGMPALIEAEMVGPTGHVLGLDLVPGMVEEARRQAASRSLSNVEFRVISDEGRLDLSEAFYDAATCKHGLMWMPNPPGAMAELCKALRPGGRVAVSSWAPPERHPLMSIVSELQLRLLGYRPMQPSTPVTFDSEGSLRSLLLEAGYLNVDSETMTIPVTLAASAEEFVEAELAEDTRAISAETAEQLRREAIEHVRAVNGDGSLVLDLAVLLSWGVNPG